MGNWLVIVKGCGTHHNDGKDYDADKMAKDFIKKLKEEGQTIIDAEFILHNPSESLLSGWKDTTQSGRF